MQSLQKKHQALEAELSARDSIVTTLVSRAANLTRSEHPSSDIISDKVSQVKSQLTTVLDLASIRKLRLQDALESQAVSTENCVTLSAVDVSFLQFYAEVTEAEAWFNDKRPLLMSSEVGRDEDTTRSLQRKLEGIQCEVDAFKHIVDRLSNMAKTLTDRNHYDSDNISKRQVRVRNCKIYFLFLSCHLHLLKVDDNFTYSHWKIVSWIFNLWRSFISEEI